MKVLFLFLAACAKPVAPVAPTVVNSRISCSLPPVPMKFAVVGWAEPGGIVVSKSDMASLVVYLEGLDSWMRQAAECLK